ncbi:MAG: GtrA family protein [Acidimicrobiales bacterium]
MATPRRPMSFLRRLLADPARRRRLGRYVVTSIVATVVSETTLLALYGTGALEAGVAAVAANLAGTLPSYLMSRYWIWPEADRRRVGRQVVLYWVVSVVSLAASSAVTGVAAADAPAGRVAHLLVVAFAYVGTYGVLWLAKFAVYQLVLFRPATVAAPTAAELGAGPPPDRPASLR